MIEETWENRKAHMENDKRCVLCGRLYGNLRPVEQVFMSGQLPCPCVNTGGEYFIGIMNSNEEICFRTKWCNLQRQWKEEIYPELKKLKHPKLRK